MIIIFNTAITHSRARPALWLTLRMIAPADSGFIGCQLVCGYESTYHSLVHFVSPALRRLPWVACKPDTFLIARAVPAPCGPRLRHTGRPQPVPGCTAGRLRRPRNRMLTPLQPEPLRWGSALRQGGRPRPPTSDPLRGRRGAERNTSKE